MPRITEISKRRFAVPAAVLEVILGMAALMSTITRRGGRLFSHWDSPFISWLESNGYNVDYCTDLDIHQNESGFLQNYNLLLSVGHDEYWSRDMRWNVRD